MKDIVKGTERKCCFAPTLTPLVSFHFKTHILGAYFLQVIVLCIWHNVLRGKISYLPKYDEVERIWNITCSIAYMIDALIIKRIRIDDVSDARPFANALFRL